MSVSAGLSLCRFYVSHTQNLFHLLTVGLRNGSVSVGITVWTSDIIIIIIIVIIIIIIIIGALCYKTEGSGFDSR
jgi:hypothetical protein